MSEPIGFALMLTQQRMLIVSVGAKPICQFMEKKRGKRSLYGLLIGSFQNATWRFSIAKVGLSKDVKEHPVLLFGCYKL